MTGGFHSKIWGYPGTWLDDLRNGQSLLKWMMTGGSPILGRTLLKWMMTGGTSMETIGNPQIPWPRIWPRNAPRSRQDIPIRDLNRGWAVLKFPMGNPNGISMEIMGFPYGGTPIYRWFILIFLKENMSSRNGWMTGVPWGTPILGNPRKNCAFSTYTWSIFWGPDRSGYVDI